MPCCIQSTRYRTAQIEMDIPRQQKPKRRRYVYLGAGIGAVVLTTVALSRLEPAAPSVDRAVVWTDTVRRGPMVRQVRGPGNLVPEQIRYITTLTPGRVDRVLQRPGVDVDSGTVLLELSNPDVHIQALQAEQQLTAAQAQLVSLHATLENQRLTQEAAVATVRSEYEEAMRQLRANEELAQGGLIPSLELSRARDRAAELEVRLDVERKRLELFAGSIDAQLDVQRQQVTRLRAIAEFQRAQVASMTVRAGSEGVLQELSLEVGQWVMPGMNLAVVVQPGRLKAVVRIPETQAKDVVLNQRATIDTRNGLIPGRVRRIDPAVVNGTVAVDVELEGELPPGARPDLSVDGTIEVERLDDVLFVGRPAYGQAESTVGLFRLEPAGKGAVRVSVRLGRSSVSAIEVRDGLQPGDVVILSDMSTWDAHERVRLR
jgi:multidrug resistance efflux pump